MFFDFPFYLPSGTGRVRRWVVGRLAVLTKLGAVTIVFFLGTLRTFISLPSGSGRRDVRIPDNLSIVAQRKHRVGTRAGRLCPAKVIFQTDDGTATLLK